MKYFDVKHVCAAPPGMLVRVIENDGNMYKRQVALLVVDQNDNIVMMVADSDCNIRPITDFQSYQLI